MIHLHLFGYLVVVVVVILNLVMIIIKIIIIILISMKSKWKNHEKTTEYSMLFSFAKGLFEKLIPAAAAATIKLHHHKDSIN